MMERWPTASAYAVNGTSSLAKPLTAERTAGLATDKNFIAEIRAINDHGGFVEHTVPDIVTAFERLWREIDPARAVFVLSES